MPAFTSNATNINSYVCFSLPTNLTQDCYLRAVEVVPGSTSFVYHLLVNVDPTGNTSNNLSGNCFTIPGDFGIGGYAPGS